jgi:hypothetical protein
LACVEVQDQLAREGCKTGDELMRELDAALGVAGGGQTEPVDVVAVRKVGEGRLLAGELVEQVGKVVVEWLVVVQAAVQPPQATVSQPGRITRCDQLAALGAERGRQAQGGW